MKSTIFIAWSLLLCTTAFGEDVRPPIFSLIDRVFTHDESNVRIPRYTRRQISDRLNDIEHGVDMRYNNDVKMLINSFVYGGRRTTERIVGQSVIYFPIFEQYTEKYNIPTELKYLAVVESMLNEKARSPIGAAGLWQFMSKTGRLYGLTVNRRLDERYDIHKSSEAAAHYLKDLFDMYQDWTLAIAAYNCGPGTVNSAIRRGRSKNFWKIRKYLPEETRYYVPKFIAVKYVFTYYMYYRLTPKYPDYGTMITQKTTIFEAKTFQQISEETGVSISMIRRFNPAYRNNTIPASESGHYLVLPVIGTTGRQEMEYLGYQEMETHY